VELSAKDEQQRGPINEIRVFDLKQSMQNGGGPACLRLRVAMSASEIAAVNQGVLMSDDLFATLNAWVERHYRDRLSADDLADPCCWMNAARRWTS
jgi:succinylarginine dihydrolase